MEQVLDWLNENELRAYPFLDSVDKAVVIAGKTLVLPDNFLIDLQLITDISLTTPDGASIPTFLKSLRYMQDTLQVTLGTSVHTVATFIIENAATCAAPLYIRNSDGNLAVFGAGVTEFLALCEAQEFEVFVDMYIEPSTVVQFNDAWLGVNMLITSPEKVSKNSTDVGLADSYVPLLPILDMPQPTAMQGDIKLLEGYNFRVDASTGKIDLEIGRSFGLRMNCTTSFLPNEYLDCHELVSYINGVPPDVNGNFKMNPGTNIEIISGNTITLFKDTLTEPANQHTLFVGLTFRATDLCAPVNVIPSLT